MLDVSPCDVEKMCFVRNFPAGESADAIASNFFVGTISLARDHPTINPQAASNSGEILFSYEVSAR
jgi:hypothetical protein